MQTLVANTYINTLRITSLGLRMDDIIWEAKCLCLDAPLYAGHTHATQHCGDEVDIDSLATHELIRCHW